jgi:hypothetical protein
MSKSKFTPGPWKINPINSLSIIDNSGNIFRELVCQTNGKERKEAFANSQLISAAPEMYEALQELLHLHSCEQEGISSGQPTYEEWMVAYQKGIAAIEKAEGSISNV